MGSPKVLIADDSPLVVRMMEKLLSGAGFSTVTAADGLDAVEKAFAQDFDLAILDVSMPRMNGYQTCRLLKAEPATRHVPVVILTSKDQASDRFRGIETGADYYITKDAEPHKILELAKRIVAAPRDERPRAAERPAASADVLARVNELLDRELYEARLLSELGEVARSVSLIDETFTSVMNLVARAADFTIGALAFVEGEEIELLVALRRPVEPAVVDAAKAKLLEAIGRHAGGASFSHVRARFFEPRASASAPETRLGGFAAFPITSGDRLAGLLGIAGRAAGRLSVEDEELMARLANLAHIVTHNSRLVQRLRLLASQDGLTEVANHRHSMEVLNKECDRVVRYAGRVSLLMIDIDHFKAVNDRHGHPAGDEVLRGVAAVLREGMRSVDTLGRYGGEEFVAILPQTEIEDARALAERLRRAVEERPFACPKGEIHVTISVGVASYPSDKVAAPDDLIRAADQALYGAKQQGRNRVS